jgi:hypothetical protein
MRESFNETDSNGDGKFGIEEMLADMAPVDVEEVVLKQNRKLRTFSPHWKATKTALLTWRVLKVL